MSLAAWSNVTRDGSELMEPNFHSQNSSKRARLNSEDAAKVDEYIMNSKMTSDLAVRTENLQAVNAILQEQAYIQPLYHNTNLFCYNENYTGVTRDPGGTFYLIDMDYAQ